jgi:hypothetical protein
VVDDARLENGLFPHGGGPVTRNGAEMRSNGASRQSRLPQRNKAVAEAHLHGGVEERELRVEVKQDVGVRVPGGGAILVTVEPFFSRDARWYGAGERVRDVGGRDGVGVGRAHSCRFHHPESAATPSARSGACCETIQAPCPCARA